MVAHEVLRLVAEHCRDLRALRIDGLTDNELALDNDVTREPIARVLEQCGIARALGVRLC